MLRTLPFLFLAALLAAGSPARQEEAVDVVFVIDSSNSMANSDKEGLRQYFLRAAVDFLQGRGGDRVSVVQFAGWFETQKRDVVVMDLTEIPKPGSGDKFKTDFSAALKKVEIFGTASDINVAFEMGLKKIAEKRKGNKNPWWVVVVTDGDFDVLESEVRPEYQALAEKKPDGANVDTINEAASEIFQKEVRPNFVKESGSGLTMSGISLAKDATGNKRIEDIVGAGSKIGNLTATPLKDLIVPLLGTSPLLKKGKGGFYGYSSGQASIPIHVYEGAANTRAILFSRGGNLKASIKGAKADILGDGPYQVIHFRDVPAGDYTIDVEGGKEAIEFIAWADFPLNAAARMTSSPRTAVGGKMSIELRVDSNGKPVTDKGFLKDLKAEVTWKTPDGEKKSTVEFKDGKEALLTTEQPITQSGDYSATVTFSAIPDTTFQASTFYAGPFNFKSTGIPSLVASFSKKEMWIGDSSDVDVKSAAGPIGEDQKGVVKEVLIKTPAGDNVKTAVQWNKDHWSAKFAPEASGDYEILPEKSDNFFLAAGGAKLTVKARTFTANFTEKEVYERQPVSVIVEGEGLPTLELTIKRAGAPLKLEAKMKGDKLEAVVPTDVAGDLELSPVAGKGFEVKVGPNSKLVIKKRAFVVKDGANPANEITIDVKWQEKGTYKRDLDVELTVGKGETGQVLAEVTNAQAKDATLKFESAGQNIAWPLTMSGQPTGPAQRKVQLVLNVLSDADLAAGIGSAKFTGRVGSQTWTQDVKVKLTFSDKGGKQFMRMLPWIILGLILLAVIIFLALLARWKEHQLRYFQNNNLDTKNLIREMNAGPLGRNATGTPQLPAILKFALTGMKTGAQEVKVTPIKIGLTVQGKPVTETTPAPLKHGDEIVVESEKTLYRFIYFEHEPTADEIAAALSGLIAGDEIFLEE